MFRKAKSPSGLSSQTWPELQRLTGLTQQNFADFVQAAQLLADLAQGLSPWYVRVHLRSPQLSPTVATDLLEIGQRYRRRSPYSNPAEVWRLLSPETRSWFIDHRQDLGQFLQMFL